MSLLYYGSMEGHSAVPVPVHVRDGDGKTHTLRAGKHHGKLGFRWGYTSGDRPRNLALHILQDYCRRTRRPGYWAEKLHEAFMFDFLAERKPLQITSEQIEAWLQQQPYVIMHGAPGRRYLYE